MASGSESLAAKPQAVRYNDNMAEGERFAVALQVAIEALEGVGLALAEDTRPALQED
jgi:hypothetical protein